MSERSSTCGRRWSTNASDATTSRMSARSYPSPVLDGAQIRDKAHDGSLDLTSMYQAIVFDHADGIAAVLTLLANPDRLPAVISCTSGKDRTGIVVGVLLAVLGWRR
ncbi:MAG: tyrosine-protein phosphatase [Acidimicrobiales bacterium]|nr:tyrosine-protein phosphatase [Acidimicrobiales bacterium]